MSEDPDFKYIIRIANSDVSGEQRLGYEVKVNDKEIPLRANKVSKSPDT